MVFLGMVQNWQATNNPTIAPAWYIIVYPQKTCSQDGMKPVMNSNLLPPIDNSFFFISSIHRNRKHFHERHT